MNNSKIWIILIAVLVLFCLCLCVAAVVAGVLGFSIFQSAVSQPQPVWESFLETPFSDPATPRLPGVTLTPSLPRESDEMPTPAGDAAFETLQQLQQALVPVNEPRELAQRLGGKGEIPETIPFSGEFKVGDRKQFWVTNVDTVENFQVEAVLRSVTDSAYFWIQDGVRYDAGALTRLANAFNNQIVPTNREFFGSEWNPGVDNDPRLFILYTRGAGSNIAGYFSSADSVHPLAHQYSNAKEMFVLSADNAGLSEEFTYGVLAHEFQHMIHWYRDRNEETWLNEGFSELAAFLNGFDPGGFDYIFSIDPDLQLNDWPNDSSATTPHYGAAFLFVAYFLDRFGEEATQALVGHPDNGLDSIDAVLADLNDRDPQTGAVIQADDVFADWAITNYLNDPSAGDGRYHYKRYASAPKFNESESVSACDGRSHSRAVNQYGTDYILFDCQGSFTLTFQGSSEVGVLPVDAHSGNYAFWSNKGDESNMTLTREFDFRAVSAPINLEYATWYDLETDYDYLYLVASEDGGATWNILTTPSCTTYNPSGNSYGCGYNGKTSGYIREEVDLSAYAGKQVLLRFEYVTDAAVNGEGLLLDDISVEAIDYFTDFEADYGGWQANGFVRIQNRLPQTFRLSLIYLDANPRVETIHLDENQAAQIAVNLTAPSQRVVLVVSGTTRFTRQEASYRFDAQR
ncbi:MAG: hypothetical protein AB1453_04410 [Chloroflexota bacterium]|jgi:hypothetical protein